MKQRTIDRIRNALIKAKPYTKTMERVGSLVLTATSVGPVGIVAIAASAANVVRDHMTGEDSRQNIIFAVPLGLGDLTAAFRAAGAAIEFQGDGGGGTFATIHDDTISITAYDDGDVRSNNATTVDIRARVRAVLASYLPQAITIKIGRVWWSDSSEMQRFTTAQGQAITAATKAAIAPDATEARTIMLGGAPGVGKSSVAREVAHAFGGRVVFFGEGTLPPKSQGAAGSALPAPPRAHMPPSYDLLGATTIVIDDADKVVLTNEFMAEIRRCAKLVILTANNATSSKVFDRAIIRPDRVDETWEIEPVPDQRIPAPFDRLDAETWARVRDWPFAYRKELAVRISRRGASASDLRLAELEERMSRDTRSGDVIEGDC